MNLQKLWMNNQFYKIVNNIHLFLFYILIILYDYNLLILFLLRDRIFSIFP